MKRLFLVALVCVTSSAMAGETTSVRLPGGTNVEVVTLHNDVQWPWNAVTDGDGFLWVTDRGTGNVVRIDIASGTSTNVFRGSFLGHQARPFGIVLHPDFTSGEPYVFITRTTANDKLHLVRYRYNGTELMDETVLLSVDNVPAEAGLTMKLLPDNTLLLACGSYDTHDPSWLATANGKILRVTLDGEPAPGNPLPDKTFPHAATNYVYTYGHRNPTGLAVVPTSHPVLAGTLFSVESGAYRNDEVNRLVPGGNYGWWRTTGYCNDVPGEKSPVCPLTTADIVPTGCDFYASTAIPEWNGSLLVGTLLGNGLVRVRIGPDGSVLNSDPSRPADATLAVGADDRMVFAENDIAEDISGVHVDRYGRVFLTLTRRINNERTGRVVMISNPLVSNVADDRGQKGLSVSVSPNPVVDVARITLPTSSQERRLRITDLLGRTMDSRVVPHGDTGLDLSVVSWPAGTYIVSLVDGNNITTATFAR